jgi:hypothetical protein
MVPTAKMMAMVLIRMRTTRVIKSVFVSISARSSTYVQPEGRREDFSKNLCSGMGLLNGHCGASGGMRFYLFWVKGVFIQPLHLFQ